VQFLKHNAAATIMFGPFVDKTDGVTLKTDATTITDIDHATTGIFLSKAGAAAAIRHQNVTASVADAYGMMKVTLDTTDLNALGTLDVLFAKAATYLPVHKVFMVVPASVYDAMFEHPVHDLSGMNFDDRLPVPQFDTMSPGDLMANVYRWDGGRVSNPATEGVPDASVINWKGATAPAMTGDAFARLGAPAGASIAADLLVIDNFVDDLETRITEARLSELDAGTPGKMAYVADVIAVDVAGLDGAAMRGTDSAALASVCTEGRLSELDAATPGKAAAEIDLIKTDTAAVLVDTGTTLDGRIPAALVGGRMDSNASAIAGVAAAATNLAASAGVIYIGSVTGAAATTTLIDSALTQAADGFWIGRIVIFTSGTLKYQATDITAFDAATDKLTFTALTGIPGAGDTYVIV